MKYVIVEKSGFEQAILLSPTMSHKDVVNPSWKVVSAGECTISADDGKVKVQAFGHSVTLNVKSRPNDDLLIESSLEMNRWG